MTSLLTSAKFVPHSLAGAVFGGRLVLTVVWVMLVFAPSWTGALKQAQAADAFHSRTYHDTGRSLWVSEHAILGTSPPVKLSVICTLG